jgi:hypothetical protein
MRVGDVVQAIPPYALACGSGLYDDAIVCSVTPLVLVSREGDMLWSATCAPHKVRVVGWAWWWARRRAMARYRSERHSQGDSSR